jgi:hypothetical protein
MTPQSERVAMIDSIQNLPIETREIEFTRHDADHGKGAIVEDDRFAENRCITAERPSP